MHGNDTINKVFIVGYYIPSAAGRVLARIKNTKQSNKALIFLQANIGDYVLLQDSLQSLLKCIKSQFGSEIHIVCKKPVDEIIRFTGFIGKKVEIKTYNFDKIQSDFTQFKRVIKDINSQEYDAIIVPQPSLSSMVYLNYLRAPVKIGLIGERDLETSIVMRFFQKRAFTQVCRVDTLRTMELDRLAIFARWMGDDSFVSHLPVILKKDSEPDFSKYDDYCVIAPSASKPGKEWLIDRFAEIANYIIENYNLNICLCGGNDDIDKCNQISQNSNYKNRIYNLAGKTDIAGWIGLIRQSKFCISCDSASVHIAVATATPSVCIAGRWHNFRFLPYQVEGECDKYILPHSVYSEVDCYGCQTYRQKGRYSDYKCPYSEGGSGAYFCIEKVSVADVIKAVDDVMDEINGENRNTDISQRL